MTPEDIAELKVRAKKELRKRMRGLRNTAPKEACDARSERINDAVLALAEFSGPPKSVALFWPIEDRHEVDLRALDTTLRAREWQIAYPSIDPETRVMVFRHVDNLLCLAERGLGFCEPPSDCPIATRVDIIVCPALALTENGARLGYGAGFYDRALLAQPYAIKIGVCFDYQLLADLPTHDHDVGMNLVVTDARVIRVNETPLS